MVCSAVPLVHFVLRIPKQLCLVPLISGQKNAVVTELGIVSMSVVKVTHAAITQSMPTSSAIILSSFGQFKTCRPAPRWKIIAT